MPVTPFEITWEAPEFEYRPKSVSWYWLSIIIAVLMIGVAIWQKNFLFGFFVVVAELLILTWAEREPRTIRFTLNERGLILGGQNLSMWSEIESMQTNDRGGEWSTITFRFKNHFRPTAAVRVEKKRLEEIQKALKPILPQTQGEPSLLDIFEELVRF